MKIVVELLALGCIVVACGALVGMIVPIPRLGLKTRKKAVGILVMSLAGLVTAGLTMPESASKVSENRGLAKTVEEEVENSAGVQSDPIPFLLPPLYEMPKLSTVEVLYTNWPAQVIPHRRNITSKEFGDNWPFTVASGTLECVTIPLIPSSTVFEIEIGIPESILFPIPFPIPKTFKGIDSKTARQLFSSATFSGEVLTFETDGEFYYWPDALAAECADWGEWLNCPPAYEGPVLEHAYKELCQFKCTQATKSMDKILKAEVKEAKLITEYKRLEAVRNTGFNLCRKQQALSGR